MTSAKPKFANITSTPSRRNKRAEVDSMEQDESSIGREGAILDHGEREVFAGGTRGTSITEYMRQKMEEKTKSPTRPITLRFEEPLWQKVEELRGNISKNDFFKELLKFYDDQHRNAP